ncbi:MAG: GIY-YIG nuclease family protein [Methanoregula sp.]|nr:GIY-YIG nuclease family protein [Methanoregula sp.]
MDKGIYCLIFKNPGCVVRVGALGEIAFRPGWHCYIGSALGSGGLKRLERHISLAAQRDKRPKWHVDYLHISSCFSLVYAVYAVTNEQLECQLAHELDTGGVLKFGCSDCTCTSHLFYREDDPQDEIISAFRHLRLIPATKTIMNPGVKDTL